MPSTQAYHDQEFLKEVWGLYGAGVVVLLARTFVRLRTVGLRHFQGDDYITILVLLCYTADAVTVHLTFKLGSNVDYSAAQLAKFSEQELSQIVLGSRMQLFAWYTYTALVWALKACMLFFFNRLTFGLDSYVWVKRLAVVCGVTYVVVFLTITLGCQPFHLNWQTLPYPPPQCTLRAQNMYVSTTLNVATDAAMLAIPFPLLWKLQVPLKRKLTLMALFSSGLFVITAAIVRITMSLRAHPSALTINRWGVRETIAGIIAVNMPILRPLFTRPFWIGETSHARPSTVKGSSDGKSSSMGRMFSTKRVAAFEMVDSPQHSNSDKGQSKDSTIAHEDPAGANSDVDDDASSGECIVSKPKRASSGHSGPGRASHDVEQGWRGVRVDRTYNIRPASPEPGPVSPARGTQADQPGSWGDDHPWDRGWQTRRYGNSVTVHSTPTTEESS